MLFYCFNAKKKGEFIVVTLNSYNGKSNANLCELVGKSTDSKPIGTIDGIKLVNGSTFLEMDTGNVFMYSEDDSTWYQI